MGNIKTEMGEGEWLRRGLWSVILVYYTESYVMNKHGSDLSRQL